MKEQLEILVIEDNPKHISDAKKLLDDRAERGIISNVDYASTFSEAQELLNRKSYDGIISDIFFPEKSGENEREYGTTIAELCLQRKTPFVLVTSTFHHGRKTQLVCNFIRNKGMQLVDSNPKDRDGEAESKYWAGAFVALTYLIEGLNGGELTINEEGISQTGKEYGPNDGVFNIESQEWRLKDRYENDAVFKKAFDKYCKGMFE